MRENRTSGATREGVAGPHGPVPSTLLSLWFAGWSGGLCALGVFAVQNWCVCGLGVLVVNSVGDGICLARQQRTE
jgi:hypothetical protein